MIVTILAWMALGLVAGWLASAIMRGGGYGIVGDMVLGILGALVGGFISSALFKVNVTGLNLTSILIATIGAIVVIGIARVVAPGRTAL
jgi:uncharacterized membrane protein YeaQ/YmgE (transglycosylase-associated protein family)